MDLFTDAVWILYERVIADDPPTKVEITSRRWLLFREFVTKFPRAQKPYSRAVWTSFHPVCTSHRPGWPQLDDDDDEMFMSQEAADKLDPPEQIDYAQTRVMMDEDGIREC